MQVFMWVRVRYTGKSPRTLGTYGTLAPGEEFSMRRVDWECMAKASGDPLANFEKLEDADAPEARVQPCPAGAAEEATEEQVESEPEPETEAETEASAPRTVKVRRKKGGDGGR